MTRFSLSRPFRSGRSENERGATSAEYALIAALIAVVIVIAVTLLGTNTKGLFDRSASSVSKVAA